jgi:antitoxin (DNA-binding transcriptional repressor) of toxin-antitoxin stability system
MKACKQQAVPWLPSECSPALLAGDFHVVPVNQSTSRESEMITVGAFEAKTKFSALLDRVERGKEVIITRNGKVVTRMLNDEAAIEKRRKAVEELLRISKNNRIAPDNWKDLRDEGRK